LHKKPNILLKIITLGFLCDKGFHEYRSVNGGGGGGLISANTMLTRRSSFNTSVIAGAIGAGII